MAWVEGGGAVAAAVDFGGLVADDLLGLGEQLAGVGEERVGGVGGGVEFLGHGERIVRTVGGGQSGKWVIRGMKALWMARAGVAGVYIARW